MFNFLASVFVAIGSMFHGGASVQNHGGPARMPPMPPQQSQQVQSMGENMQGNMPPNGTSSAAGMPRGPIGMGHMGSGTPMSGHGMGMRPGITGTVTAINGTTITIASRMPMPPMAMASGSMPMNMNGGEDMPMNGNATTTYTVDTSAAQFIKIEGAPGAQGQTSTPPATTSISISDISVGDKVMVQGPVTGMSIIAKTVIDGVMPLPPMQQQYQNQGQNQNQSPSQNQGQGSPQSAPSAQPTQQTQQTLAQPPQPQGNQGSWWSRIF